MVPRDRSVLLGVIAVNFVLFPQKTSPSAVLTKPWVLPQQNFIETLFHDNKSMCKGKNTWVKAFPVGKTSVWGSVGFPLLVELAANSAGCIYGVQANQIRASFYYYSMLMYKAANYPCIQCRRTWLSQTRYYLCLINKLQDNELWTSNKYFLARLRHGVVHFVPKASVDLRTGNQETETRIFLPAI